jgi:hypothetical protein
MKKIHLLVTATCILMTSCLRTPKLGIVIYYDEGYMEVINKDYVLCSVNMLCRSDREIELPDYKKSYYDKHPDEKQPQIYEWDTVIFQEGISSARVEFEKEKLCKNIGKDYHFGIYFCKNNEEFDRSNHFRFPGISEWKTYHGQKIDTLWVSYP